MIERCPAAPHASSHHQDRVQRRLLHRPGGGEDASAGEDQPNAPFPGLGIEVHEPGSSPLCRGHEEPRRAVRAARGHYDVLPRAAYQLQTLGRTKLLKGRDPCTSVFKPVWLGTDLPDTGPTPVGSYDEATLFWRHETLHRATLRDYATRSALYRDEREGLERRFIAIVSLPCRELISRPSSCFAHRVVGPVHAEYIVPIAGHSPQVLVSLTTERDSDDANFFIIDSATISPSDTMPE